MPAACCSFFVASRGSGVLRRGYPQRPADAKEAWWWACESRGCQYVAWSRAHFNRAFVQNSFCSAHSKRLAESGAVGALFQIQQTLFFLRYEDGYDRQCPTFHSSSIQSSRCHDHRASLACYEAFFWQTRAPQLSLQDE